MEKQETCAESGESKLLESAERLVLEQSVEADELGPEG